MHCATSRAYKSSDPKQKEERKEGRREGRRKKEKERKKEKREERKIPAIQLLKAGI